MAETGFYLLPYDGDGPKPGNVWDVVPGDEHRDDDHPAVYPVARWELPVEVTCPEGGVALHPFVGTGTTVAAANSLNRRGLGIDASERYLRTARERLDSGVQTTFDAL